MEPCVFVWTFLTLPSSLWSHWGFWQSSIRAVCLGPGATATGGHMAHHRGQGQPSSVTPWHGFISSAFLLASLKIYSFEEDEFLPKCPRFGWGTGPCCPLDGNSQISCSPASRKLFWSPHSSLLSLHTFSFLSAVPLLIHSAAATLPWDSLIPPSFLGSLCCTECSLQEGDVSPLVCCVASADWGINLCLLLYLYICLLKCNSVCVFNFIFFFSFSGNKL